MTSILFFGSIQQLNAERKRKCERLDVFWFTLFLFDKIRAEKNYETNIFLRLNATQFNLFSTKCVLLGGDMICLHDET